MHSYQIVIIGADVEKFSAASGSNCRFLSASGGLPDLLCCRALAVSDYSGTPCAFHSDTKIPLSEAAPRLCVILRPTNSTIALFKSLIKKIK